MSAKTAGAPVVGSGWISAPALIAVLIWSGMGPIAKFALGDFPSLAYAAYRPVIAATLLFAYLRLRREPLGIERRDWGRMVLAGMVGMGLSQVGYVAGLARTSVSHNVILLSTSPLIAALVRWIRGRAAPERRTLLGVAVGFAGVVLLVAGAGGAGGATLLGDLLSLGGAIAWMGATVWPASLLVRYGPARVTAWLLVGAAGVTVPVGAASVLTTLRQPPPLLPWLTLLYSAVLAMLLGNALWQRAVQEVGATRTLVYLYLEPLGSLVLAAIFLGERLGPIQALGGLCALGGVALVRKN